MQYTPEEWQMFYNMQQAMGWQVPQFGAQQPVPPQADIMDVGQLQTKVDQTIASRNLASMVGMRKHIFETHRNTWGRNVVSRLDVAIQAEKIRRSKPAPKQNLRRQIVQRRRPPPRKPPPRKSATAAQDKIQQIKLREHAQRVMSQARRERETTQPENMTGSQLFNELKYKKGINIGGKRATQAQINELILNLPKEDVFKPKLMKTYIKDEKLIRLARVTDIFVDKKGEFRKHWTKTKIKEGMRAVRKLIENKDFTPDELVRFANEAWNALNDMQKNIDRRFGKDKKDKERWTREHAVLDEIFINEFRPWGWKYESRISGVSVERQGEWYKRSTSLSSMPSLPGMPRGLSLSLSRARGDEPDDDSSMTVFGGEKRVQRKKKKVDPASIIATAKDEISGLQFFGADDDESSAEPPPPRKRKKSRDDDDESSALPEPPGSSINPIVLDDEPQEDADDIDEKLQEPPPTPGQPTPPPSIATDVITPTPLDKFSNDFLNTIQESDMDWFTDLLGSYEKLDDTSGRFAFWYKSLSADDRKWAADYASTVGTNLDQIKEALRKHKERDPYHWDSAITEAESMRYDDREYDQDRIDIEKEMYDEHLEYEALRQMDWDYELPKPRSKPKPKPPNLKEPAPNDVKLPSTKTPPRDASPGMKWIKQFGSNYPYPRRRNQWRWIEVPIEPKPEFAKPKKRPPRKKVNPFVRRLKKRLKPPKEPEPEPKPEPKPKPKPKSKKPKPKKKPKKSDEEKAAAFFGLNVDQYKQAMSIPLEDFDKIEHFWDEKQAYSRFGPQKDRPDDLDLPSEDESEEKPKRKSKEPKSKEPSKEPTPPDSVASGLDDDEKDELDEKDEMDEKDDVSNLGTISNIGSDIGTLADLSAYVPSIYVPEGDPRLKDPKAQRKIQLRKDGRPRPSRSRLRPDIAAARKKGHMPTLVHRPVHAKPVIVGVQAKGNEVNLGVVDWYYEQSFTMPVEENDMYKKYPWLFGPEGLYDPICEYPCKRVNGACVCE